MFEIEKGIAVPAARFKYPWAEMEIGDSFFVEPGERSLTKMHGHLSSLGNHYGKPRGMKFTTRQVDGGVRVWRVK